MMRPILIALRPTWGFAIKCMNKSTRKALFWLSIILVLIAVVMLSKKRQVDEGGHCISNLRLIDSTKEQWRIQFDKHDGDEPTWDDLYKICPLMKDRLKCPQGGTYSIEPLGKDPKCSFVLNDSSGWHNLSSNGVGWH